MTKLDGARRLIHTTTRMIWANEDSLAINLLAQSADQLTANLYTKQLGSDLIWDSAWIKNEHKSELMKIVRNPSNFVKHADRDPNGQLQVYELQVQAEIATFFSILRFRTLSNSLTCHMKLYLGYHNWRHPGHMSLEGVGLIENLLPLHAVAPSQFRTMWGEAAMLNPIYRSEILDSKSDSN
jgi:hypothetical protein